MSQSRGTAQSNPMYSCGPGFKPRGSRKRCRTATKLVMKTLATCVLTQSRDRACMMLSPTHYDMVMMLTDSSSRTLRAHQSQLVNPDIVCQIRMLDNKHITQGPPLANATYSTIEAASKQAPIRRALDLHIVTSLPLAWYAVAMAGCCWCTFCSCRSLPAGGADCHWV
eukprot:scpid45451/ scgid22376/ 